MATIREKSRRAIGKMKEMEKGAGKAILIAKESPLLREFREFAMRGNMIDLAIGIMIGGGFNKIVTSLVNDVIMPPIGLLVGKVDFSNLFISLSGGRYTTVAAAKAAGAPTLNYGLFLNNVIDFLILAFTVFLVVRQINKMRRAPAPPQPNTKECPFCLSSIPLRATRCPHCTSPVA